jgi:hypothetical protein
MSAGPAELRLIEWRQSQRVVLSLLKRHGFAAILRHKKPRQNARALQATR